MEYFDRILEQNLQIIMHINLATIAITDRCQNIIYCVTKRMLLEKLLEIPQIRIRRTHLRNSVYILNAHADCQNNYK